MTKWFERFMLARGWVRVSEMTAAVNRVAADAAVDRLADVQRRIEAEDALEATTGGIAIQLDGLHDRMPVLS